MFSSGVCSKSWHSCLLSPWNRCSPARHLVSSCLVTVPTLLRQRVWMKFLMDSEVTLIVRSKYELLTHLVISPSSLSMHLWPKGILGVTGHCLAGVTAERKGNTRTALLKGSFSFGPIKILGFSTWESGILQIQADNKGAFNGGKTDEWHRFPPLCNACHIFLSFSSQLFCLELLTLADCLW